MPPRIVTFTREKGDPPPHFPNAARELLVKLRGPGIGEDDLSDLAGSPGGAAALPFVYFALELAARQGLLLYRANGEKGPLLTVSGGSSLLKPHEACADRHFVFSRFALMRREGTSMLIESSLSSHLIEVHDPRVVTLIAQFTTPSSHDGGLQADETAVVLSLLVSCGIFVDAEEASPPWEFHNLLFHARTRLGRNTGSYGGTYGLRDRIEPLPTTKPAMSENVVNLDKPDLARLRRDDLPFTEVLERRSTTRTFGDPPIDVRQLGEFLYRAARQRRTYEDESGEQVSSRPYPGGGACYELEIYVSVATCTGLQAGLYHYDPREHRLFELPAQPQLVDVLLRQAAGSSGSNPQVLLSIAARFGRMFRTYESIGYAAILKDAGVLYQTMYLVAESMGLGACALGGGSADVLCAAAGLNYYEESAVGEFLIGSADR